MNERKYDSRWRKRRNAYVRRVGGRCERCGASEGLEVHHVDPRGSDEDANLECLCRRCHRKEESSREVIINTRKLTLPEALKVVRDAYMGASKVG